MKVHELLSSPDKWTKGAYARNDAGYAVPATDPEAVSFCLLGAIQRCYLDRSDVKARLFEACYTSFYMGPINYNDAKTTTHADVIRLVKDLDI